MNGIRGLTLGVRFLCELGMLVALAYWGFATQEGAAGVALGIGAPIAAALVWGLFVSPRAVVAIPVQTRLIVEFFLLGFTALALVDAGQPVVAVAFGLLAFGSSLMNASQMAG